MAIEWDINNTNLQVEDKLWDDILLNQSNGTASPSSSGQPRPEGTIVTANLDELFQFGAAILQMVMWQKINKPND